MGILEEKRMKAGHPSLPLKQHSNPIRNKDHSNSGAFRSTVRKILPSLRK